MHLYCQPFVRLFVKRYVLSLNGNRYAYECEPPEWKERGTGDVRILKKPSNESARILMRREKTLKVCANHFILPWMNMKPNCGSDKELFMNVDMHSALQVFSNT